MIGTSGLSGGLDIETIVSQLMALERRPLSLMNQREEQIRSQLTAWGSLKTAVSTFADAATTLAKPASYSVFTGELSDASIAAVSTTGDALPATYSLTVTTLAASQKLASKRYTDSASAVGAGTLTIDFGSYDSGTNTFTANANRPSLSVTIAAGADSLAEVRDAINAANGGVTASIINDGTGAKLVLSSTDSGLDNSLRVTVADADGNNTNSSGLSALAYNPTGSPKQLTQVVAPADARITLDGITITSPSNTIATAIEGVTLSLAKKTSTAVTLTVGRDETKVTESVEAFVKAYNDLNKQIRDLTFYDQATNTAGKLQGESAVISIQNRVRAELRDVSVDPTSPYQRLTDIGITLERDGSMKLDKTKLEAALAANPMEVVELFAGTVSNPASASASTSGIAGELAAMLGQVTDVDGLLSARTKALGESIERIDDEQERFERRLDLVEARYRRQFSGLDEMLAGLSQISTFLTRL